MCALSPTLVKLQPLMLLQYCCAPPAKLCGEPDVLVLHTADAQEWATYLQQIMKSSRKFRQRSVLLYELSPADHLHGYDYECYRGCGCILLLVTGELLDMLANLELQGAVERLVSPPHRVVALLCGVTEEDAVRESFKDWESWRKISAEDEPQVYISTILETITDSTLSPLKPRDEFCLKGARRPKKNPNKCSYYLLTSAEVFFSSSELQRQQQSLYLCTK